MFRKKYKWNKTYETTKIMLEASAPIAKMKEKAIFEKIVKQLKFKKSGGNRA